MFWLITTLLAYFFLAIVSLFDRYFLVGSIPNHKNYTFYIGIVGFFIGLILLPFGIKVNELTLILICLGLVAGFMRIFGVLFLAKSISQNEISRVIPAMAGFLAIFSFILFWPGKEILNFSQTSAFVLLLIGSILISSKKLSFKFFTFKILKHPMIAAFFFALYIFLMKTLFLKTNFLTVFSLILIGGGLGVITFLFFPEDRKNIFTQKLSFRISRLFLLGQCLGGLGVGFQNYAIFLAKPNQVPLINALEGARYVFLLFFVFLLSIWKPSILKEEMKGAVIFQKILAILLIGAGLVLIAL